MQLWGLNFFGDKTVAKFTNGGTGKSGLEPSISILNTNWVIVTKSQVVPYFFNKHALTVESAKNQKLA